MAIKDYLLTFSTAQAETTVAAHDSTNHVDLAGVAKDLSEGKKLILNVVVREGVTSGGAATLQVALQDSADDSSFAAITPLPIDTGALAKTVPVAGYKLMKLVLPFGIRRYLKLVYTIGTAVLTAGTFDAWIDIE